MPFVKVTLFWMALLLSLAGCSSTSTPVDLRDGDSCAHCRMKISDARVAAQIAAPGEEPLFYDDIGCLARALAAGRSSEFAYVADHRTGEWVPAATAVYTRVPSLETPMGSHIVGHADDASRQADPDAVKGSIVSAAEVFGRAGGGTDGG